MSEPTKQEVIALYKPPFRFECGYIWDAEGKMDVETCRRVVEVCKGHNAQAQGKNRPGEKSDE